MKTELSIDVVFEYYIQTGTKYKLYEGLFVIEKESLNTNGNQLANGFVFIVFNLLLV